jgi:hypothetical protein
MDTESGPAVERRLRPRPQIRYILDAYQNLSTRKAFWCAQRKTPYGWTSEIRSGLATKQPQYRRAFCCPALEWLGEYGPRDEVVDPEEMGTWRVWYRIEKG